LRRLRPIHAVAAALLAGVLLHAQGSPPAAPLVLLSPEGRRAVPTILLNNQEYIALEDLAALFRATAREDPLAGGVTVTYNGRTALASTERPMASVGGRLLSMPSPAIRSGGRPYVPLEFVSRAFGLIYDRRIELRRASRLLIVGDLRVPRVTARIAAPGPPTRVEIDVSPAAAVSTTQQGPRVTVRIEADALDAALPVPGAGLVEQIRAGDQPGIIEVLLRGAAGALVSSSPTATGTRVTIEAQAPGTAPSGPSEPAPAPLPDPATPVGRPRPILQTIVIDPGHGGDDRGTVGAGSIEEKRVTLDVARRVKTLVETRLGIRVILTREDDRAVRVDERGAIANNNKADLFVSVHANASPMAAVAGAEVYYLALDEEMEAARRLAQAESVRLPVLGGGTRTIDVIRWDMAQARHIEASAAFAGRLEEELRERVPVAQAPLRRAPMRVLVGVNMPAALVEIAYLTNPPQARRAATPEFQTSIAQAIYEAVLRMREWLEGRQ
jgi:N-acetylmuramoyl-L-alanine amidase